MKTTINSYKFKNGGNATINNGIPEKLSLSTILDNQIDLEKTIKSNYNDSSTSYFGILVNTETGEYTEFEPSYGNQLRVTIKNKFKTHNTNFYLETDSIILRDQEITKEDNNSYVFTYTLDTLNKSDIDGTQTRFSFRIAKTKFFDIYENRLHLWTGEITNPLNKKYKFIIINDVDKTLFSKVPFLIFFDQAYYDKLCTNMNFAKCDPPKYPLYIARKTYKLPIFFDVICTSSCK